MTTTPFVVAVFLLNASQGTVFTGTLADKPTADRRMTGVPFTPSARTDVPGFEPGDKVVMARATQLKSAGAPAGIQVVLLLRGEAAYLFADRNADGKITDSDRIADLLDTTTVTSWDHEWQLPVGPDGALLPVSSRITVNRSGPTPAWMFLYSGSYRVEGHVEIDGRKTLVSLPFKVASGTVDVTSGYIGIDSDGDGKILSDSLSPEYVSADGKPAVIRLGNRFVAIESADLKARTFTLRERPASEYTRIDVRHGSPLDDFAFTDYEGKARKLSDFRGKHVLLDFWGSWCKPCVDDLPGLKEAYERYRERGFEIVGIDYEMGKTAETVRPFLAEKGVPWVNGTPESVRSLVDDRFRINSFPTLILLDPKGVVIEARSAELRGKRLVTTLERVFGK